PQPPRRRCRGRGRLRRCVPAAAGARAPGRAWHRGADPMILDPIVPTALSVRRLPNADPALLLAYGAEPARHRALGLITCDQDDALYVALDEATKHADVDVVFARSFYAGAAHGSGALSGEILGVL